MRQFFHNLFLCILFACSSISGISSSKILAPVASVPGTPTILKIIPGDREASVYFTAPSDGGSAILDYEYQLDNGSWVTSGVSVSPVIITNLVNYTTYSIKIRAKNAIGAGVETSVQTCKPYKTVTLSDTATSASGILWTTVAKGTSLPLRSSGIYNGLPGAVAYYDVATGKISIDPKGWDLSLFNFTYTYGAVNINGLTPGPFVYSDGYSYSQLTPYCSLATCNVSGATGIANIKALPAGQWTLKTIFPARIAGTVSLVQVPTLLTSGDSANIASTSGWLNNYWSFGTLIHPDSVSGIISSNFKVFGVSGNLNANILGYGNYQHVFQYTVNGVTGNMVGALIPYNSLQGEEYVFSKNGTGDWSDAANWVGGVVPGASSTVTISQGNAVVNGDYSCTNLTISTGTSVTIDPNNCLSVSGTLTNNAGVGGLVLASTASGNGALLNNTTGVNASVKQFLTKNKWHYIGIPVNYVDDVSDVLYHAYVLLIDESDAFDDSLTGWNDMVSGDSLIMLHGYAVNYTYPGNSDTTITFTGILNTGTIDTVFASENEGWNFISNPYPCTMNWDASGAKTITNGNDAFYVWQPNSEVYGTYGSYITGGATNGQTQYISSNQGFFFEVWATEASIAFTNSAKVSNSVLFSLNDPNPANLLPSMDEKEPPLELLQGKSLLLGITDDGTHYDEALIRTSLFARTDFDSDLDAAKLIAFESKTPQIFSISNGREYSINTIPKIANNSIIPVTILSKSDFSQTLSIRSMQNMDEYQSINLYDSKGVFLCDLKHSTYSYLGQAGMEKTFYVSFDSVKKSAIADFHQTVENSREKFQRVSIKQLNQGAFTVQSAAKSNSDNQSSSLIK